MKLFTQELKEGENIIRIIHKHWASFIVPSFRILLGFSVSFFFSAFLFSFKWGLLIFILLFVIALVYAVDIWMKWYFDLFVLTNYRILNIDQKGIFTREVSEVTYKNVQGVNYELTGIFAMLFNYGTVKIQAIGIKNLIKIESVENPKNLQELILKIKEKSENQEKMSASELINFITKAKSSLNEKEQKMIQEKNTFKFKEKEVKDE